MEEWPQYSLGELVVVQVFYLGDGGRGDNVTLSSVMISLQVIALIKYLENLLLYLLS